MKYLEIQKLEAINSLLASHLRVRENGRFLCRLEAFSCKSVTSDRKLYKQLESKFQQEIESANNFSTDVGNNSSGTNTDEEANTCSPRKRSSDDVVLTPTSDSKKRSKSISESAVGSIDAESGTTSALDRYWALYNPSFVLSPFGPLTHSRSRKTFYSLISVLNAVFPDYDFSDVKPEQFSRLSFSPQLFNNIRNTLFSMAPNSNSFEFSELCQMMWNALDDSIDLNNCEVYSYLPDMECDPFTEEGVIQMSYIRRWSFNYFFYNKKMKRVIFMVGGPNRYPLNPNPSVCNSLADYDMGRVVSPCPLSFYTNSNSTTTLHHEDLDCEDLDSIKKNHHVFQGIFRSDLDEEDHECLNKHNESPISPMFAKVGKGEIFR